MLYGKDHMCAENFCTLLTFTENFAPLY